MDSRVERVERVEGVFSLEVGVVGRYLLVGGCGIGRTESVHQDWEWGLWWRWLD